MRAVFPAALLMLCLTGDVVGAAGEGRYGLQFDGNTVNEQLEPWRINRGDWLARVARARARYAAFAARAIARAHAVKTRRRPIENCSLPAEILADPTLRRNDLYIEQDRVFVFRGDVARKHLAAEFERLPAARVEALGIRLAGAR